MTSLYRGVSLLISLILVGILVLFSLGVSNLVVSSIRESANVNQANQAYYAAEGGLEKGLLVNANQGTAGYSKDDIPNETFSSTTKKGYKPGDPGVVAATVKIQGKSPASSKIGEEYVIPTPGTGTAGKDCDPLNPNVTATVSSTPPTSGLDDACNWNKIKVGETVGVPLYATDGDGSILNPVDLKLKSLKVKVRTPCETDSDGDGNCLASERYELNGYVGDAYFKCRLTPPPAKTSFCGDTIVSWQIIGTNVGGDKTYTLAAPNDVSSTKYFKIFSDDTGLRKDKNSEIYETLITDAGKNTLSSYISGFCSDRFCVLDQSRTGVEVSTKNPYLISDFITNIDPPRSGTEVINKPILKLSIVNSLIDTPANETVPYLEYQITSNTDVTGSTPADSAQTITAEGFSGPFKQVLEVRQPQETGLLEYVIQQ